jgi:hypothetical protein
MVKVTTAIITRLISVMMTTSVESMLTKFSIFDEKMPTNKLSTTCADIRTNISGFLVVYIGNLPE